jgi:hypothetical protein
LTGALIFLLVTVVIMVVAIAVIQVGKNRQRIKRMILDRLIDDSDIGRLEAHEPEPPDVESEPSDLKAEESRAELARIQKLIEDRKQIARDTDLSYHLWGLYRILVRYTSPQSLDRFMQGGEWFEVKILHAGNQNDLNRIEFELKGAKYSFVNDEEQHGWSLNMKSFSLFLYDDSDNCLIEIPMKLRIDSTGRNYSVASSGPEAFLAGDWVNDIINVKLKHQSIRNREIRAQEHEERLCEIEELRGKFGIWD